MYLLTRLLCWYQLFLLFLAGCISYVIQLCWHFADDYRLFCGDLGNEVNDDVLSKAFARFPSFNMAKVSSISFYFFCSSIVSKCLLCVNILHFIFRFLFEAHRAVIFLFILRWVLSIIYTLVRHLTLWVACKLQFNEIVYAI